MTLLRASDHRRMPWKNGGGETLEVAIAPAHAGVDAFDWRVSMAVVAIDGPFSIFPGVDRTLALLDGDGMTLDIAGQGRISLTPGGAPFAFPADAATSATLTGGPITDLNVMTARGRYAHTVERLVSPRDPRAGAAETLLVLGTGTIVETMGDAIMLGGRDVVLLAPGETARVRPAVAAPCLLVTIHAIG